MVLPPTLNTTQLTLRPVSLYDAEGLHAVYSDPETMRFMPSLPHQSVDETREHLEQELASPGSVHWSICKQGSDEPIGRVNYLGQTALPGMGYIIRRDQWGKGYATEACRAALDYGFAQMALDRVELWIDETNLASRRVAQKLDFRLRGNLPLRYSHESTHHIMQVYGMWAYEWQQAHMPKAETTFFNAQPVLMVHDVEATAAFFQEKLGFRIDFLYGEPPNHGGLSRGDWSGRMVSLQITQVPPEREIVPSGYIYIMVDVTIDELFAQYKAGGVDIVEEPETQPWGMREFTVRELNGHILRFGTHWH